MEKEVVITKIEEAFKDEKYPGDSLIVYDNTGYHLECLEIRNAFKGKSWDHLHENFLFEERSSLYFFSKQGFKYYLPAFMLISIRKYADMDDLPDIIIGKLTMPAEIDTVIMANKIKQYRIDKQIPSVDFNEFLQNSLKGMNKEIHDFIDCMTGFTKEQSTAIKLYLEYISQYSDDLINNPAIALERYWFQF
jgi:hypothetical protein